MVEFKARGGQASVEIPTEFSSRRLVSIQCLRGIAALMVVVHHVIHQSPGFLAVIPTEAFQSGVDLFFVISGFVMVYVTSDRERSAPQFLAMRAARIIPVYWFYTLAAAALVMIAPQLFRSNEASLRHVLMSMFFIPHRGVDGTLSPLVKQGWTLNYEVFFYVLFTIALAVTLRHRVALAVSVLFALAAVGWWMGAAGIDLGTPGFYFQDIIVEFGFGMLIAAMFLRRSPPRLGVFAGSALVVAGFAAIFVIDATTDASRMVIYGIPAAAIVVGALTVEGQVAALRIPLLQFAGDASYSVYLVHIFPVAVLRALWPRLGLPLSGAGSLTLFLVVTLVLVIGFGAVSYFAIERTSLRWLRVRISGVSRRRPRKAGR